MSFVSDLPRRLGRARLKLGRVERYVTDQTLTSVAGAPAAIVRAARRRFFTREHR